MTSPRAGTFVQFTRRPWVTTITSGATGVDLTTIASAVLYVHRVSSAGVEAVAETWACVLGTATATTLPITNTPTASGAGSCDTAGDVLTMRPILTTSGGLAIECAQFVCNVVEK